MNASDHTEHPEESSRVGMAERAGEFSVLHVQRWVCRWVPRVVRVGTGGGQGVPTSGDGFDSSG